MKALSESQAAGARPVGEGKRPERYSAAMIDASGIHPLKYLVKFVSRALGPSARFFAFGLPEQDQTAVVPSDEKVTTLTDGIASGVGANLTARGQYVASLTPGAGPFIESRFLRRQKCFPRIHRRVGTVVSLISEGQVNYYRWLMETLPRFRYLEQAGAVYDEIYACQSRRFHQESLRMFKPAGVDVLASNQVPNLCASRLLVPGFVREDEPWIVPWLRERISTMPDGPPPAHAPRRLYISRRNASGRRIANEEALTELLQEFGFTSLLLEDCGWLEQVRLFRDAEAIIGAHGAGLANIIFCTDALIVEFMADAYPFTYYPQLSQQLKLEHHLLSSRPLDLARIHGSDLEAPLSRVREILEKSLSR